MELINSNNLFTGTSVNSDNKHRTQSKLIYAFPQIEQVNFIISLMQHQILEQIQMNVYSAERNALTFTSSKYIGVWVNL